MELFFAEIAGAEIGRPFILDQEMRWMTEVNHFLRDIALVEGKTTSPFTRRAYAYHLLDWLNFCERVDLDWRYVSETDIASYRNALLTTLSPHTKKPLMRETVIGRVGTICLFYQFMLRKKYIEKLPFSFKEIKVAYNVDHDPLAHVRNSANKVQANRLNLRTYDRQIEIPPNKDIGLFIRSFCHWRNRLIAELMWLTGMRRIEVCRLNINSIPEDPFSIMTPTKKIRIKGKGDKLRWVNFPVRLLRSITRYVQLVRNPRVKKYRVITDQIWVGEKGSPIRPPTINKVFLANSKKCGFKIDPHDLRHSYAVNRLLYLEENQIKGALKIVQMELGHEHITTTQRYLHLTEKMRADVVATHADFIDRLTSHMESQDEEKQVG